MHRKILLPILPYQDVGPPLLQPGEGSRQKLRNPAALFFRGQTPVHGSQGENSGRTILSFRACFSRSSSLRIPASRITIPRVSRKPIVHLQCTFRQQFQVRKQIQESLIGGPGVPLHPVQKIGEGNRIRSDPDPSAVGIGNRDRAAAAGSRREEEEGRIHFHGLPCELVLDGDV